MSAAGVALTLALAAGVLLYSRRAAASTGTMPVLIDDYPEFELPTYGYPIALPDVQIVNYDNRNLRAFLYAIRSSEHTENDVAQGLDYFTFYSGLRFNGTSDHPAATGEMKGIKLPDSFCRAVGLSSGCVSTAAGAFQINLPTFRDFQGVGASRVNGFNPAEQNEIARRILIHQGAMPYIESGDFVSAITRAAPRWASLPGSTAKQGTRTLPFVLAKIEAGLNYG